MAPSQVALLDKLFGRVRDAAATEASLYGEFAIGSEVTLKSLRETYDLPIAAGDDTLSVGELFRREFRTDLEVGDRLHLGPVDLIVREMRDGRIMLVGISLDPAAKPLDGWERFKAKLSAALGTPSA